MPTKARFALQQVRSHELRQRHRLCHSALVSRGQRRHGPDPTGHHPAYVKSVRTALTNYVGATRAGQIGIAITETDGGTNTARSNRFIVPTNT